MGMNRVQFQPGLSLPEFYRPFGTEEQCAEALEQARWSEGFRCPHCALPSTEPPPQDVSVRGLPSSNVAHCGHLVPEYPSAADVVVSGHLSRERSQNRVVGYGAEAAVGGKLSHRQAPSPQADASHVRTR